MDGKLKERERVMDGRLFEAAVGGRERERECVMDGKLKERERVMDGRLFEAAVGGNKEMLLKLLEEEPQILDRGCGGKDNPLHVGALYGHVEFVREILNEKLELTRELNSEGQSPLHLASARGHAEVVKEILSKDADACLTRKLNSEGQSPLHLASARGHVEVVKEILREDADARFIRDGDGMIPLHLAAIKGQLDVLETLVEAKRKTPFILTKSGEPILHLCANNNKFKALEKLVELVTDDNFLNLKDSDDNTILHVLSDKNQSKLIRLLVQKGTLDVNAVNIHGSMPLDVSIGKLRGLQGWATDSNLIAAGAKRSVSIFTIGQNWMIGSWFNEALLVVAILMVTVAFQAGINPPGGVWQDTGYHNATLPNAPQSSPPKLVHHYAGQSVMSHVDPNRYKAFSLFNRYTLLLSIFVIVLLLKDCFVKSPIYKLFAIYFTFISVCTMWAANVVSLPYISSDAKNNLPILSLVMFTSITLLVIIIPPNFHVVWFETLRFASGHRRTTSVQAGAVGRP